MVKVTSKHSGYIWPVWAAPPEGATLALLCGNGGPGVALRTTCVTTGNRSPVQESLVSRGVKAGAPPKLLRWEGGGWS